MEEKQFHQINVNPTKNIENTDAESMYINNTRIVGSIYDFTFHMAHVVPNLNKENKADGNIILKKVIMSLSPQHAKAFHKALSSQIEAFEALFGTIHIKDEKDILK